jgi:hypothetical protein
MTLLSAALESLNLLAPSGDFFWTADLFKKDKWEPLMKGTRVALTVGGALLLIYEMRAKRMGEYIAERHKRWVAYVLTVLAFGVYFDFGNPNTRYSEYYHRHEFYHYYLGSKFFKEVGYKDLYFCTAIAEIEAGRGAQVKKREIRDLNVNLIKPMEATYVVKDPDQCKKRFTPERWTAFKADVEWFYKSAAGSYWESMMKDHGYNPPPVWGMAGKFFGSFAPAGDRFFKILSGVDVLFHLGTVLLFGWAFGWRAMAVATVFWGCNAPANFYWTGGAFLRQDWIFFLIAALCLCKKRWFVSAGVALTWSALLRVFPLILFFGWGIIMGLYILDRLRHHGGLKANGIKGLLHTDHWRLLGGVALAIGVLVPASMAVNGTDSYKAFYKHTIATHANTPLTNQMGLETMLVHTWDGRMRFMRDDNMDDPFEGWKKARNERKHERMPLFLAIIAGVGLWTVWALRRTRLLWVAIPISVPMLMCLTNLTCYYYSFFMTLAALITVRPQLGPAILATSGASTILLYSPSGYYWVDDRYTAQTYLFFALGLLALYAYSRPFSLARLRAWWEHRPEPRAKETPRGELGQPTAAE